MSNMEMPPGVELPKKEGVDLSMAIEALQGLEEINQEIDKTDKLLGESLSELRRDTKILTKQITDHLALTGEGQSPDFRSNFELIARGITQIQEFVREFKKDAVRLEEKKNNLGIYLGVEDAP